MNKYVNIKISGEGNIAVLDLGKVDAQAIDIEDKILKTIEPKLVQALESHFCLPVKIHLTEVLSTLGHIHIRSTVIIDEDEDEHKQIVEMEETWIY